MAAFYPVVHSACSRRDIAPGCDCNVHVEKEYTVDLSVKSRLYKNSDNLPDLGYNHYFYDF